MAKALRELRGMSQEELVSEHDSISEHTVIGLNYYLAELSRRDAEAANNTMLKLTKQMRDFTAVILALTVLNVLMFVGSVFLR